MEKDTTNRYVVGMRGDGRTIVSVVLNRAFTREEATNLAAWLLVMSGVDRAEFMALVDAIEAT